MYPDCLLAEPTIILLTVPLLARLVLRCARWTAHLSGSTRLTSPVGTWRDEVSGRLGKITGVSPTALPVVLVSLPIKLVNLAVLASGIV